MIMHGQCLSFVTVGADREEDPPAHGVLFIVFGILLSLYTLVLM
jgi:hypothetical protein